MLSENQVSEFRERGFLLAPALPGARDLAPLMREYEGALDNLCAELPAEKPTPLPMRPGDVLFLHRRLLHSSLPNTGAKVRWSFDLRHIPAGAPSGREAFPCFIARSRANPESEVRNPDAWRKLWLDARGRLAKGEGFPKQWNRWNSEAEMCA